MDFDEAIESHNLWKSAFLHYIENHEGEFDLERVEEHLNHHSNMFDSLLKIIGLSSAGLSVEFIESSQNCHLGQWLSEIESIFKGNKDFSVLIELHHKFHKCAAEVLKAISDGDKSRARTLLKPNSEFVRVSDDIEVYLGRIRRLVKQG